MKLSEVVVENENFRFDSEYFKKEYLHNQTLFFKLNVIKINELCTDNIFIINKSSISTFNYLEISCINTSNPLEYSVSNIDGDIPDRAHYLLENCDIVVSTVRPNRNAVAFINDKPDVLVGTSGLCVLRANSIVTKYLLIFCKTKYFFNQIMRMNTATMYPAVTNYDINKIKIPIVSNNFQLSIASLVVSAYEKLKQSKILYAEAEQLLLEELELIDFKPSTENIAIKTLSESFGVTGRLDAEYYQPKYEEIENKIKSYKGGYDRLGAFVKNCSTGYPFKSDTYQSDGFTLIRINNIQSAQLNLSDAVKIPYEHKNLSAKDIVRRNEILISMSGTIGSACKIPEEIEAVINQRIMKISIANFYPDMMVLIINSIICSLQLEKIGTGGVQTNISAYDIQQVIIPLIPLSMQKQIEKKVQESFALRAESQKLLSTAKQAVEIAIEENEENALAWISNR